MSCSSESPCNATLTSSPSADKRVRYGMGMLLGVADFEQEQAWFLEQDRNHARTLHGCGVIGGLAVELSGTALKVSPGMAIDALGRVISVGGDQCANLNAWLNVPANQKRIGTPGNKTLNVVLRYCECATDPQPVPGQPCRSAEETMSATRITASFTLDLEPAAPKCPEEAATIRFGQWLRRLQIGSGTPTLTPALITSELKGLISDAAVPTTPLYLSADQADGLMRHALALWAQLVRPALCCHDGLKEEEIGIPLAALSFTLGADYTASDVKQLAFDPPVLLSTRLIQEALFNLARQIAAGNSVQALSFGSTGNAGLDTAYSRADHVHPLPALPPIPAIPAGADTVAALVFGGTAVAGSVGTFSRGDHQHALPALPTLAGDVGGAITANQIERLQGKDVKAATPAANQVLTFKDDVWQPADVPTGGSPAPTNVVLHPAGLPDYSLVAAGVIASGRSIGPTYNELEGKAAGDGLLLLTFKGYRQPTPRTKFTLLVKALPVVHKEFPALSVSLAAFRADGFLLEILSGGKAVPEAIMEQIFVHVEVSLFTA